MATQREKIRQQPNSSARVSWGYWGWLNLIQFTLVLAVHCLLLPGSWNRPVWWPSIFPEPAWNFPLVVLVLGYLAILIYDLLKQFERLDSLPPAS